MASKKRYILLNSIGRAREFVDIATKFSGDITLVSNRGKIDGKSLINILSTDIRNPMEIQIFSQKSDNEDAFIREIEHFLVEE